MKFKTISVGVFLFLLTTAVAAQNKISGTLQCSQPEASKPIEVGDHANHSLGVAQTKCNWTKPMEIVGIQTKEGVSSALDDIGAKTIQENGYHVGTMANGDKYFVRYRGTNTLKEGKPEGAGGTWSFTGGTGKMKGLKGKGTYKGTPSPDGNFIFEVEGEYELPK
jgi:hypothetical protein